MSKIGNILHNSTSRKNSGEHGSDDKANKEVSVVRAMEQHTSLSGMENEEVDHKYRPPTRNNNIYLNYFFNPIEDTTKKNDDSNPTATGDRVTNTMPGTTHEDKNTPPGQEVNVK